MTLQRLTIEDFGLIERAEVAFADGLTVFSGETGSGKTMLLGALAFALGARSETEMIRAGAERARVMLEIETGVELREELARSGIESDAGETIAIVREMSASGRSSARVNGVAVSAGQLRALSERVIETVGQHEAQRLLSPSYQLELLDRFGGEEVVDARARVSRAHAAHAEIARELARIRSDAGDALAAYDFAKFALTEIDQASPEPGEDERLHERRDYLSNIERIAAALAAAHEALAGEGGAIDALGAASSSLAGIARFSDRLGASSESVAALQSEARDAALELAREREASEYDPAESEAIGARLELLDRLKKKYGGNIASVCDARLRFAETIENYESRDERIVELESGERSAAVELQASSDGLRTLRARAAAGLEAAVVAELAALAMPAARFFVGLEALMAATPNGADRCELLLAPNPGEPARPLAKSASGGELSRVLLALIVVLAERRERTAIVFDEVDAGIGGATANAVGVRLGRLATESQVVVVTHLAQIASWADSHYALRKHEKRGVTTITAEPLDPDERRREIARMLAGDTRDVALDHARTMLSEIAGQKSKIL
ncbi:MAG TPA: DNA repair protein RecN [Candidatus Binatia bacterium]|nr:DNA repair protein RecN [Candidatus Binatia bacterium]